MGSEMCIRDRLIMAVVFIITRVYRHPVRYFSSTDAYRLIGTGCAVWIFSAIAFRLLLTSTSSMLLSVSCLLSIVAMCAPRLAYQQWFSHSENRALVKYSGERIKVVVCGVNTQSIGLCNLLVEGFERAKLVGIISDDKDHLRREVHGIEVIGLWTDLDVLQARYQFDQLWIGAKLSAQVKSDVKNWCARNKLILVSLEDLNGFDSLVTEPVNRSDIVTKPVEIDERIPQPVVSKLTG